MENKGKIMMIVIIALLLVLIITIVGVSIYAMKALNGGEAEDPTIPTENTKVLDQSQIYTYSLTAPVAVNLAVGSDGQEHSASVEVGIGVDISDPKLSDPLVALVESQEVVLRDAIISVLRTKTVEELEQVDSQELIKEEILDKLKTEFNTDLIYSVYFGTYYYD